LRDIFISELIMGTYSYRMNKLQCQETLSFLIIDKYQLVTFNINFILLFCLHFFNHNNNNLYG